MSKHFLSVMKISYWILISITNWITSGFLFLLPRLNKLDYENYLKMVYEQPYEQTLIHDSSTVLQDHFKLRLTQSDPQDPMMMYLLWENTYSPSQDIIVRVLIIYRVPRNPSALIGYGIIGLLLGICGVIFYIIKNQKAKYVHCSGCGSKLLRSSGYCKYCGEIIETPKI